MQQFQLKRLTTQEDWRCKEPIEQRTITTVTTRPEKVTSVMTPSWHQKGIYSGEEGISTRVSILLLLSDQSILCTIQASKC